MSHIRVLICRVDDPTTDHMTELAAFDLPTPDVATLEPTTTLDDLETVTQQTGNAILRQVLQAQWELIDAALVAQHRQYCIPQPVAADGHEPVSVASRDPILTLSRQVCQHGPSQPHVLPGNVVLPPHHGIIITRGLQEWACLLPHQLSFASVARLLGWQTHEAQILGETTVRSLVRSLGQIIRQAEQAEVAVLAAQHNLASVDLQLVPHGQPRRRVGWPAEVNAAVDAALAADQVRPPSGVS